MAVGDVIRRLFNIYPGEGKKALQFALVAFLAAFGVICGLTLADGIFLEEIGTSGLPLAYLLTAGAMLIVASFFLYSLHFISVSRIFTGIACFEATFILLMAIKIVSGAPHSQWVWYMLKVGCYMFMTVTWTGLWTFIDQYYDLQDAKRLYGLFNSAMILGATGGSALVSIGIDRLNISGLLFVVFSILMVVVWWITNISKRNEPVPDDTQEEGFSSGGNPILRLIKAIIFSRFTLFLLIFKIAMQLLAVVTEYNYMNTLTEVFGPEVTTLDGTEENLLTRFLGQSRACVYFVDMIWGIFIYARLIKRVGMSNVILLPSAYFVLIFTIWPIYDSLFMAILGLIAVEGILYGIEESNFTLLLNAVPTKLKTKIRVMIESFFEPIGILFSALLLMALQLESKLLGLGLSIAALIAVLILRSNYSKSVFQNLAENAIHFERKVRDWIRRMSGRERRESELRLLRSLNHLEEPAQLLAYEFFLTLEDPKILQRLISHADKLDISTKIRLLDLLDRSPFATDPTVIDGLDAWEIDSANPDLNAAIHFYLAKHGLLHPDKVSDELSSPHLQTKSAAILSLTTSWAHTTPTKMAENRAQAAQLLKAMLDSDDVDNICMALKILGFEQGPNNIEIVLPFLKHPSPRVVRGAMLSIAELATSESKVHIPLLITQLQLTSDPQTRLACLRALGKIGDSTHVRDIILASVHFRPSERRLTEAIIAAMGLRTVPALLAITKDQRLHDRCRLLAGRILGRLALPQLQANLYPLIRTEIERAYFYFYHCKTIQKEYPVYDLRILEDGLLSGFHSVIDFIIQLLGMAGSLEDVELLSRSLRSHNQKIHSQAVETLERTCDRRIFNLLAPLVSDWPDEERLKIFFKTGHTPLSLQEVLDQLQESPSLVDQILSATLKAQLHLPGWQKSLRQQMETNDEIFHHFAYELLEGT